MAKHPQLALSNNPGEDISSYYEVLQINPMVFDNHFIIILQVPLVNESLIMNIY